MYKRPSANFSQRSTKATRKNQHGQGIFISISRSEEKKKGKSIRAKAKRERWLDRASVGERREKWNGKKGWGEREKERERSNGRRDPLDTCLLSTFGSSGNKRRKAVRRQVYGHGINYRRFRTFLRKCNVLHARRCNAYTHWLV